jgi:hypothetical protein
MSNNWHYENVVGTTGEADQIIRAHCVLGGGLLALDDLAAMVDMSPQEWDFALHSIEVLGYGAVIDGALVLTVTPLYADPDAR